jgi:hypothetical protein
MLRGGIEQPVMQCHCTPDGERASVCVGFALQVGGGSVSYRLAATLGVIDHESLGTDEDLHTLRTLLQTHGGRP